jgi:glycosyltransferase involved in cell wall biosynthesis
MPGLRFISSTWQPTRSWGKVAHALAKYLKPPVGFAGIRESSPYPPIENPDIRLLWGHPSDLAFFKHPSQIIVYTTWETTKAPSTWKEWLARAREVWATSNFAAETLGASRVIRLGLVPLPEVDKISHDSFIVGSIGNFPPRKGFDILIRAFDLAFKDKDAELWLISSSPPNISLPPRVKVFNNVLNDVQLATFYSSLDCFAQVSRGEGFGLCPLEAASMGIPCLVTDGSALRELIDNESIFRIRAKRVRSPMGGEWYEGDYRDLANLLIEVYNGNLGKTGKSRIRHIRSTALEISNTIAKAGLR